MNYCEAQQKKIGFRNEKPLQLRVCPQEQQSDPSQQASL